MVQERTSFVPRRIRSVPLVLSLAVQARRVASARPSASGETAAGRAVAASAGGVASTTADQDRVAAFPAGSKKRSVTR